MFDMLFGWRKASKCKKLIKRVRCRLKLLKNKRCCIVRQLRADIAELLKHGHEQIAFDRVEQLFIDESAVAVYDLLDNFCEFIVTKFPYIRKHKDCPNDINEAVSSLIYASARFGDLPELSVIRKLFGERYGQRFATVALELLPGNLVNREIKEKGVQSVSEDDKYRLVDEIARSCLQSGPLLIEHSSEYRQQLVLANKSGVDQNLHTDFGNDHHRNYGLNEEANCSAIEAKTLYIDPASEGMKSIKDPGHSCQASITSVQSSCFSTASQESSNPTMSWMHKKDEIIMKSEHLDYCWNHTIGHFEKQRNSSSFRIHTTGPGLADGAMTADSSSEGSAKFPKEMIYLDDIEEFESTVSRESNFQDQRLFKFKSSIVAADEKIDNQGSKCLKEQYMSEDVKRESRSLRRSRKASGKRLRRQSTSVESVVDLECAIYYGESCESSPNFNKKSHRRRKHHKKVAVKENNDSDIKQGSTKGHHSAAKVNCSFTFVVCKQDSRKLHCRCRSNGEKMNNCSLEHPCYFCTSNDADGYECGTSLPKMDIATLERLQENSFKEKIIQHEFCYYRSSQIREQDIQKTSQTPEEYQDAAFLCDNSICPGYFPNKMKKNSETKADAGNQGKNSNKERCNSIISMGSKVANPWTAKESQAPYARAMTMPPERLKDNLTDGMPRSNSLPTEQNGSTSFCHVHPKLPDYDELAAKFIALKEAYLSSQQ